MCAGLQPEQLPDYVLHGSEASKEGHRYVVPLPGLCNPETLLAFTSAKIEPSLMDNESMRVSIDSLETTLQFHLPVHRCRIAVDLQLIPFLVLLSAYCLFVYFASTQDLPVGEQCQGA